jgi:phosphomannomutase/phosphoglucomutase
VRGVVGKTLDCRRADLLGPVDRLADAAAGLLDIVVGRDGRLSGPELAKA